MHKKCNVKIEVRLFYEVVHQRYTYFESLIDSRLQRESIFLHVCICVLSTFLYNKYNRHIKHFKLLTIFTLILQLI